MDAPLGLLSLVLRYRLLLIMVMTSMSNPRNDYLCAVGKRGHARLSIFNKANHEHIKLLLAKLDLHAGMVALDVACGTGDITCQMAELYPDAKIVGIDVSEAQLELAQEKAVDKKLKNVTFLLMSAYDISALAMNYQFDRIFMRWVLGHLAEPRRVIAACQAVLKPQGIIICEEGDIQTHHCQSTNQSFQQIYGFFVTSTINLQKKRGIDATIGAKLAELFRTVFAEHAQFELLRHQIILQTHEEKQAASTFFIEEVEQKMLEEGILTQVQLDELKINLAQIVADAETNIAYTADVSVKVTLQ